MKKATASALSAVAAFLVLLLANPVHAAIHPLDLPVIPADSPHFSAGDNAIQRSLEPRDIPSQEPRVIPRHTLTIASSQPTYIASLLVGYRAPLLDHRGMQNLDMRPSEDLRDEWNFMRHATAGPSALERLADMFDVEEDDRPWSTTTTVHVLSNPDARPGTLVPFATFAHEVDVNEDFDRIGIGAGAMIILGKNATLGAEVIQFGNGGTTGSEHANDAFSTETRFLTRLQLSF